MTLFIKDLVSIGAVDHGDNPDAEIVFWKRRKAKMPDIKTEADMEAAMEMLREHPDDDKLRQHIAEAAERMGMKMPMKAQPEPGATEGNRMETDTAGVPEAEIEKLETELIEAANTEPVEKAVDAEMVELLAKARAEADEAKAALAVEVAKRRDAELVMKIKDDGLVPLLGAADEIAPNLRALEAAAPEAFAAVYGNLVAAAQRVDLAKAFAELGSNPGEADNTYEGLRDAYVAKRVAELGQPASPDLIIKLRSEFALTNPNAGKE